MDDGGGLGGKGRGWGMIERENGERERGGWEIREDKIIRDSEI